MVVYLTEALGAPAVYANSADGLDGKDTTTLPPAAHTHLNWAFTKPGIYRLTMTAQLDTHTGQRTPLGEGTFSFAGFFLLCWLLAPRHGLITRRATRRGRTAQSPDTAPTGAGG